MPSVQSEVISCAVRNELEPLVRDGFLRRDELTFTSAGEGLVRASGTLVCAGTLLCHVEGLLKAVDAQGDGSMARFHADEMTVSVMTSNLHLAAGGMVFRYEARKGCPTTRRVFDPSAGADRREHVQHVQEQSFTLSGVLEDVRRFYWDSLET